MVVERRRFICSSQVGACDLAAHPYIISAGDHYEMRNAWRTLLPSSAVGMNELHVAWRVVQLALERRSGFLPIKTQPVQLLVLQRDKHGCTGNCFVLSWKERPL